MPNAGRSNHTLHRRASLLPETCSARLLCLRLHLTPYNRDHDELRHSFRSALAHFRPHASTFHLIASDFPFPSHTEPHSSRLGMMPQWLNPDTRGAWRDGNVKLNLVHHAQLYSNYQGTSFNRYAFLPPLSPNTHVLLSFSIESQLDNLPSSDNM